MPGVLFEGLLRLLAELELLRVVLQLLVLEGQFLLELLVQVGELLLLAFEDEKLKLEVFIQAWNELEVALVGVTAMVLLSECFGIGTTLRLLLAGYLVLFHAI